MYEKQSRVICSKKIINYKFKFNISKDDFNKYKKDLLIEFNKKIKFYAINDLRYMNMMNISYINYLLDMNMIFTDELIDKLGCTIIITNIKNKNIFNLIMKLSKTQVPYYITTTLEDAIKYILLI